MKKIAVVVLHFVNQNLTNQCLESIKKLNTFGVQSQVIIVNNNPNEDLKKISGRFKEFTFIETGKNLGFAEGNNIGIKRALLDGADYVFMVNNDTILEKKCLFQLFKVASSGTRGGIFGPKVYFAPGYEFHKERYKHSERGKIFWYAGGITDWGNILTSHRGVDEVDEGQYNKQTETDFVSGCAMFVEKEVFEKIGLFDNRYFLYWEDIDFCQRALLSGFKIIYVPNAWIWHANAGSSAVGGNLQDYFLTRNRMLFGMKFASWRSKFALFREGIWLLFNGRLWQKIGIKDYYLGRFGQGSWPDKSDKM